ncbi:uncharacterized protein F4822DRAFT_425640 [Hypoxylon trugodes]|uniref:uncharacterized protein n=1 Tax=Hypoxylon trugodes TaxID=326681 RepID=UPI00219A9D85|nr:uncharacterized protein F4822DRAFT_425640 [Hypoxylon trugodes]KAI1392429.1 hypothetical protein F4822DRAFT_425640 [Hypoxylon trugodes]
MAFDASRWLQEDVKDIDPSSRQLLETYSGLSPEEVVPHVLAICIGQMRFIRLTLASYPSYSRILERLRTDPEARYLDLGCCFGQDIRKLFVDGVKEDQLVGVDLIPDFNTLSYELFRDATKLKFEFHALDILDDNADFSPLEGRFDVLHLTSFLHIWNWEGQIKVALRIVSFTKPGSILVGSSLGSGVGGEFPNLEGTGTNFRQSEETFQKFWLEVSEKTGTRWTLKTIFKATGASQMNMDQVWAEPTMGVLLFEVTRTE